VVASSAPTEAVAGSSGVKRQRREEDQPAINAAMRSVVCSCEQRKVWNFMFMLWICTSFRPLNICTDVALRFLFVPSMSGCNYSPPSPMLLRKLIHNYYLYLQSKLIAKLVRSHLCALRRPRPPNRNPRPQGVWAHAGR